MDEAMVNLLWKLGEHVVTSEFTMGLKIPAYVGEKLIFTAGIEKQSKKIFFMSALCQKSKNEIVATGFTKCIKV